ncbi:uncharacterized protein LOC107217301 isoform X1 [Neodiprion lecontei]|uniref:Uncharacterized protein LOC107217301 isoform X1 n=2 Tax=Neodiprion lecontei TaxID=441921 RepID=A0A6J0B9D8_NEOLC|nr:uncharacterized protein LOC107217301 isoform X1 [Neodiprion lecontei]
MEHQRKIQKWIDLILADKLESVASEIKKLSEWDLDPKLNKIIFKALLCLSHSAERLQPLDIQNGKRIFTIADELCYALIEVPDFIKYFSSLYYVARKLIIMQLYNKAMNIIVWSFAGNIVYGLTPQELDVYPKIASLWRDAAVKVTGTTPPCNLNKADYQLLLDLINNELRVLEVIVKERTMFVLCRTFRYLKNLDILLGQFEYNSNQNHRSIIRSFLARINVGLTGEGKYDVYKDALRFINSATALAITSPQMVNAPTVLADSCSIVETTLSADPELSCCILLYRNMGMILLKSISNSKELSHWELSKLRKETLNSIQTYQDSKGATLNMQMIDFILQPVLVHWERYIAANNHEFLKAATMQEILGLIQLMFTVLNSSWSDGCEVCRDNNCAMRASTHTVTVVSMKCLATLSKIPANDLLSSIFPFVQELLEETVAAIFDMKQFNCAQWYPLWNNCAIHIYNLSVSCHKVLYEESVYLFSLLCSAIVKFDGLKSSNSLLSMKNPLSYVLHRLCSVHYNHGSYREALTLCALNGLLSYQNADSKAFRMWASIKHTCATSSDILSLTMLTCLREDTDSFSLIGIKVRLEDYDLNELCIQELRGLLEGRCNMSLSMQATLDELEILNSGGLVYAQGVQMLGYHMLQYQYDQNFTKYLKRAIIKLKEDKTASNLHLVTAANLDFYTFVVNLHDIIDHTKAEMQTTKFALRAAKSASPEGEPNKSDAVVPAYTKINIVEDSQLFVNLNQALSNWSLCIENNVNNPIEEWHLLMMLRTLVIVGEFCRLHHFSMLEGKAWNLAYKLASNLKDASTCLYVVGRSISLWNVNNDWIKTGNELMTELQTSSEPESNDAIAFFCLGLSKFYFEIGKYEEGAKILDRTVTLPSVHRLKNVQLFLLSMKTALQNYPFCSNDTRCQKQMTYLVKCLYSLLVLMEYSPQPRAGVKKKQLYTSEILLTCTAHLSLCMNSLLSFKEISSHLTNRLKLAQSSGLTLRVAECLKNLCYIDLSRMQLDDCLVKLQGLEYILDIEHIKESQNTKNPETLTTGLNKPGCRDSCVNDSSPVFRKTVFKQPKFLEHINCLCYKCSSVCYQHLVLASTHIRAQLYFLQGYLNEAMSHFGGAFVLQRKMLQFKHCDKFAWQNVPESDSVKQHPWKCYYNAVEHVLFLINFSRFIRELEFDDRQDGMSVALQAVDICERFHLQSHPVYVSAKEMVFEYQFCNMFQDSADFDKFTVPDPSSINVNKYICTSSNIESSKITTPAMKSRVKKPRTIRRNKTPPLLKLTKVSIDLDEYEDVSQSPKSSRQGPKASRDHAFPKSVRRKNLEKYLDTASDIGNPKTNEGSIPGYTEESMNEKRSSWINSIATLLSAPFSERVAQILVQPKLSEVEMIERLVELVKKQRKNDDLNTGSLNFGHQSGDKNYHKNSYLSIKDEKTFSRIINLTAFLFPSISKQLTEILDETGLHGSDKNERIIELVKQQIAVAELRSESLDIKYLCNGENSQQNCHLSSTKPDHMEKLVSSLTETHIGIEKMSKRIVTNAPRLDSTDEGSWMPGSCLEKEKNNESLVTNLYEDTLSVVKNSRVKFQFADESETDTDQINGKMDMRPAMPERIGHKERLRSSARVTRSRSHSSDIKQKRHLDDPDVVLSMNEVYESKTETCDLDERKTKFKSSAITRSKSQQDKSDCVTPFEIEKTNDSRFDIENSILLGEESLQSNNSDLIQTSDLEEQAMIEKRSKSNVQTCRIRTSARILRSKSQLNGTTSSNVKISNTTGSLSTSSASASTEMTKSETCMQRSKTLATSRIKKFK